MQETDDDSGDDALAQPPEAAQQQSSAAQPDWQQQDARAQHWPKAALYMIATPIGNLRDITLRALDCLKRLDALAAEDTRLAQRLLRAYGLSCSTFALHQHNEAEASAQIIARLAAGERVGYVSDAGTPAVSDPGARLVAAVNRAGHRVVPIPGPSALTSAVSVAGLPDAPLHFIGFLPSKTSQARRSLLAVPQTGVNLVLYEAPHRIAATLDLLTEVFGEARDITVARELTKQFETVVQADLGHIKARLEQDSMRGEFVVLLHASTSEPEVEASEATRHDHTLSVLMQALPTSEAVALAVKLTGAPKNALYTRALELRKLLSNAD